VLKIVPAHKRSATCIYYDKLAGLIFWFGKLPN